MTDVFQQHLTIGSFTMDFWATIEQGSQLLKDLKELRNYVDFKKPVLAIFESKTAMMHSYLAARKYIASYLGVSKLPGD